MQTDPADDAFAQRRDAVTAHEWRLRPAPDRHWLLWLVLAVLLVFVAWQGAEWLLRRQGAAPPVRAPSAGRPSAVPSASSAASVRVAPDADARAAPPESVGVTKCVTAAGKAEYADGPCPAGSRATTVWVQPDVNLADGMTLAEREASVRRNRVVAAQSLDHERQVAQNTGDVVGECAALDARIRWIDATARQPQGAPMQDW